MPEYHGNVKVGGPAQTHELAELMITKVAVGPMDNNAYLLRCRQTDEQVLIDAANEADTLLDLIGDGGLARIVTTHRHQDHWEALAEVVAADQRHDGRRPVRRRRHPGPDRPARRRRRPHRGRPMHPARHPPRRPHARARSPSCTTTRTAHRTCSPATRLFPGGPGEHPGRRGALRFADGRPRGQGLRPAARRDLGLPRPRQRHDPWRGTPLCS